MDSRALMRFEDGQPNRADVASIIDRVRGLITTSECERRTTRADQIGAGPLVGGTR